MTTFKNLSMQSVYIYNITSKFSKKVIIRLTILEFAVAATI